LVGTEKDRTPVSWSVSSPDANTRRATTTATHTGSAITGGGSPVDINEAILVDYAASTPVETTYCRGVFSSTATVESSDTLEVEWTIDWSNQ
jgi:hypothetical protein